MAIYEITTDQIRKIPTTTFGAAGLRERGDLQRLLRSQIDVISPETLVIAEEFGEWEESKRRIDLLGLDQDANLVVIELKRTEDGGHMELQAIRYAAMVSKMTFSKVVDVYASHLRKCGSQEDAQSSVLEFLGWDEPDESQFAQDVRIILVSAEFSKELTTAVMWLNERDLDIRCIRISPYDDNGRVLIDVQQVIPLAEAAEYQIQIREKEQKGRQDRAERNDLRRKFWEGLLARAKLRTPLHAHISPTDYHWVGTSSGTRGLNFNYLTFQTDSRVELYIDRGSGQAEANKRIFDTLREHREAIEAAFGGPLEWARLDGKQASRVSFPISLGSYRSEESKWPEIQDAMIDAMIRLEQAVRPEIAKLRFGA
jgi:hypothetical protein